MASLKSVIAIALILMTQEAHTQPCFGEAECASQLVRVAVAGNALASSRSDESNLSFLLPLLEAGADSAAFNQLTQTPVQLQPMGMPHSKERCLQEKREGDPLYAQLDCDSPSLCALPTLNSTVREQICFRLPCPVLEGSLQVGACQSVEMIYPGQISFPEPLRIEKLSATPKEVKIENGRVKMCVQLTELELNMSAAFALNTQGTQLADDSLTIRNINPRLDAPREVCISARVNFNGSEPLEDVRLEVPGGPFISDSILREAAPRLSIEGLSGYSATDIQAIQNEVVPVLFQPVRSSIEEGIKRSLSEVLRTNVRESVAELRQQFDQGRVMRVDAGALMTELGVANMSAQDSLAVLECATIQRAGGQIPAGHSCLGLPNVGTSSGAITQQTPVQYFFAVNRLRDLFARRDGSTNITSENIRQRLLRVKEQLQKLDPFWVSTDIEDLDKMIDGIVVAQTNANLPRFMELQAQLGTSMTGVGLSLPDICDANTPSAHEGRSIPNCPIQVYSDLKDMNALLGRMWENGQMCAEGRGAFVPERDSAGQPQFYPSGMPRGSGCKLEMSGMTCYLKSPPQLRYIASSRRYATSVQMEKCFHYGFLGIGKFGGDLNINYNFRAKACNNGDFCAESPNVNWSVVPGTARFALQNGAAFNQTVMNALNDGISGTLGSTVRLPLASATGVLGSVPLRSEGRVDTGAGFFGACLEVDPN